MAKRWQVLTAGLIGLGSANPAGAQDIPTAESLSDAVGTACVNPITMDMPAAERQAAMACSMRALAVELSRSVPIRLNEITTVVRVTSSGGQITYHNRVDADPDLFTDSYWNPVKADIARNTCTERASSNIIAFGGSFRWLWIDRDGNTMTELVVDHC